MNSNVTIVTGLWDLGRGDLQGWANRSFEEYKKQFFNLLEVDVQLCLWIPSELEQEVKERRGDRPTHIFIKELHDFETWNPFFDKIQEIRNDDSWKNSAGWLADSPQAALKYYNPMMMCKMFMLHDSSIINPFGSEYLYWMDGGLTSTVNTGYFKSDKVLDNVDIYSDTVKKFTFVQYPYEGNTEIHGFERKALAEFCGVEFVNKVSRGGFFGGSKKHISEINSLYYTYLQETLSRNLMGADECLFTILSYRHEDIISNFEISGNGLMYPFFENLKKFKKPPLEVKDTKEVSLYVLSYNSPKQFKTLIKSIELYDITYLEKTEKFLLNNSTDTSTFEEYSELCKKYNFTEIKKDNIGICGGRQFIAEHFDSETTSNFYLFFEDDMFFYNGSEQTCRNGFIRKVENLFSNSLEIVKKEKFDFLKLNFSEFFGDNHKQWSWHNVSADLRKTLFPENPKKTDSDVTKAPNLLFKNILSVNGLPYATGEVYYCNWPQIVSREGNKKMFLDTKWAYPYEQTWMSHIYQETIKGKIKPGILLATPTEHDRFDHYSSEERREN